MGVTAAPSKRTARSVKAAASPPKKPKTGFEFKPRTALAPRAANGLSPEMAGVLNVMLADIDQRLAEIGRETDGLLASYNLA